MEVHDVSQYIHANLPHPSFYIQDILPVQGVMLLYGQPKVRKSWLAEWMGFCIATGSEFLNMRTTQGVVLLSNFEISPLNYHWRLVQEGRHFELQPNFLFEYSPMLMYLDDDEVFNRFVALLRTLNPNVLVIDCMAAAFGGDENNSQHVAAFIEKLTIIRLQIGCSIILVHHTNKNELMPGSVNRARGHSRLTGWVDTLCYMAEQPGGAVQLQIKARQGTREIPNLNIKFENYMWSMR